jgi:hypothetical protein
VASRWQSVADELVGTTGKASGKESGGGAHRGRRSTARQGGGSVQRRVEGKMGQREGDRGSAKWNGMAQCDSSSLRTGEDGGVGDVNGAADRWGWATSGPGGSDRGCGGARASGAARRGR